MPEWLNSSNNYVVTDKKSTFLMKNQKGLLFILEKFDRVPEENNPSALHPALSFLTTFAFLLLLSLTRNPLILWFCGLYLIGRLLLLPQKKLRHVLGKSLILIAMPLLVYLPSLLMNQANLLFLLRLPLIACLISQYIETTTTYELLCLLKRWHFPNIVLFQLDITIKYIYLLAKVMLNMIKGITVRHVGNRRIKMDLGTNVIALIYLRSLDYGEKLQQAMEARGFDGTYHAQKIPFKKNDYLYGISQVLLFSVIFLIGMV